MKFIHFGCWNNLNNGQLMLVMNKLKEKVNEETYQFISVAGDNYYPLKEKEEKKYNGEKKDKEKKDKGEKKDKEKKKVKIIIQVIHIVC